MNIKNNPLLENNTNKYNSIQFSKIKSEHFIPALEYGIKEANSIIDDIVKSDYEPTFDNTIVKFENAFDTIEGVVTIYYHYFASIADDSIRSLVSEISNINTKFNNDIYLNEKLFDNIKNVYDNSNDLNLDSDDKRLLDETYQ